MNRTPPLATTLDLGARTTAKSVTSRLCYGLLKGLRQGILRHLRMPRMVYICCGHPRPIQLRGVVDPGPPEEYVLVMWMLDRETFG